MRRLGSVVMLALLAASAGAQKVTLPPDVQPGARVRATTPGAGSVTGRVVAMDDDSLQVVRDHSADTVRVATSQLSALDLSVGQHKRRWAGAGLGFLAGMAIGAVVGGLSYHKSNCTELFCDLGAQYDVFAGAVLLGGAGTIAGAIIGAGSAEDWRPVVLGSRTTFHLFAPSAPGRVAIGASLRF